MASATRAKPRTVQLVEVGQSPWLDSISRGMLTAGELKRMVDDGWITGVTSNPSIFEKAVSGSTDYDEAIRTIAGRGRVDRYDAFVELAVEDIRAATDVLRPVYDRTHGKDGYVSLEVPPGIEDDTERTIAEAKRLWALVDRPNVMIKVPGNPAGILAFEELVAAGVNINITLLFALSAYEATAQAYVKGLERGVAAGGDISRVASVASFFVSRVDTAVDALLPAGSPLRGKAAVANARVAYGRFQEIFSGPRWEKLAAHGAMVQRPLWASTGTKDPAYSDVLYVDSLVAPDTVNTMPAATLKAVLDHADVRPKVVENVAAAKAELTAVRAAGVDLDAVTAKLLKDGLASFEKDFLKLLDRIEDALAVARVGGLRPSLGPLEAAVARRLERMTADKVVERLWAKDFTLWKPDPAEITNRLGWLTVHETMAAEAAGLKAFAVEVAADGYTHAVLLGMGGSSLAPEVLRETFGVAPGMLKLTVLDTTDPEQILGVDRSLDLAKTMFIVSSKSGGTLETRSHFDFFWERCAELADRPRHFVIVTDAGSALEKTATERKVRRVFQNPSEIGGRYSALSFFGLVPAALMGVDIDALLAAAREMSHACHPELAVATNPGAWLGAVMGEGALAGRDKVTLVLSPALATLGYWVEQLIAESTGKEGKGILPVEGEALGAPAVYGSDRLFIAIGDDPKLAALEAAGHPVVRLPFSGPGQLGAEFFRWEFATAIAGQILEINAFDQPNVQEAKDATAKILAGDAPDVRTDSAAAALTAVHANDYIAITAYLPRNAATIAALDAVRLRLRDHYYVPVTVGFGPRFLHSTGQLHKGGANNGVFLQIVAESAVDVAIPGQRFTFGELQAAQAAGDLASLKAHGRRAARLSLEELQRLV